MTADLDQVSFSADLAPTLYQLTGHPPRPLGPLFGRPIIVPSDTPITDERRWESFLIVSGYAPTYAVLRRNGRRLYIVDLLNRREYQYRHDVGSSRQADRGHRLRTHVQPQLHSIPALGQLAAAYHFTPRP